MEQSWTERGPSWSVSWLQEHKSNQLKCPPVYMGYPRTLKDFTQEIIKIPYVLSRQRRNQANVPLFLLSRGGLGIYLEDFHPRKTPSPHLKNYKLTHFGSLSQFQWNVHGSLAKQEVVTSLPLSRRNPTFSLHVADFSFVFPFCSNTWKNRAAVQSEKSSPREPQPLQSSVTERPKDQTSTSIWPFETQSLKHPPLLPHLLL